jgi:hypothetical protein
MEKNCSAELEVHGFVGDRHREFAFVNRVRFVSGKVGSDGADGVGKRTGAPAAGPLTEPGQLVGCPQCPGEVASESAAVSDAGEALEDYVARIGELAYHSLDGCG